jgi:4-hydroxybenzoate polyprenyltransferase
MSNNVEDVQIDKVSNKNRPLVLGTMDHGLYKQISWIMLVLALATGAMVDIRMGVMVFVFIAAYWLYSMPPWRLKRVPVFSKFLLAFCSLVMVILGYYFVSSLVLIPAKAAWFILIGIALVLNFIDIKDYKGDLKEGIKTVPVLLGLKRSKRIVGSLTIAAYLGLGLLVGNYWFTFTCLVLGIVQYLLIIRETYKEKWVMLIHLLTLMGLIVYLYIR